MPIEAMDNSTNRIGEIYRNSGFCGLFIVIIVYLKSYIERCQSRLASSPFYAQDLVVSPVRTGCAEAHRMVAIELLFCRGSCVPDASDRWAHELLSQQITGISRCCFRGSFEVEPLLSIIEYLQRFKESGGLFNDR